MLGMEHALDRPAGLRALVVADSPASIPLWVEEANRLRALLPGDVEATLRKHEEADTTSDPDYEAAVQVFYDRHLCRVPMPDCVRRSFAQIAEDPTVYHTMNGPSEFHVIGTIKDWDITERLGQIEAPTLVFSGRYDEVTPAITEAAHRAIPGSEYVVLEESSHMAQAEEPERTLDLVRDFLGRAER
jgi:L-proline amide hydrolase